MNIVGTGTHTEKDAVGIWRYLCANVKTAKTVKRFADFPFILDLS